MIAADKALARLREGNQRFAAGRAMADGAGIDPSRRAALADSQQPLAIILGCSDSRVPAEFVFDQGLGDLFVIRVAGNIVAPSQIGSVEFAASSFGTRLVVVLGHTNCGAVKATLDELQQPGDIRSPNLRAIVDFVRPSVEALLESDIAHDAESLMTAAVRENIRTSTKHLRHGSAILENLIETGGLMIVGAMYSLNTGIVDFFDMPANS